MSIIKQAQSIKKTLSNAVKDLDLSPLSDRRDAFHNPIANMVKEGEIEFTDKQSEVIEKCEKSAKLVLTEENYKILKDYFFQRKKVNDKLGNLYKTLYFHDFILRLFNKRFKEVYYNGLAIVLRDGKRIHEGKPYLERIGTVWDRKDIFKEYLTLEEAVLSTLIMPQVTSLVIGTGSRSSEEDWDVEQELKDSIDIATISYPAAAEFRGSQTAHYDLLFIVKPAHADKKYLEKIKNLKKNTALMQAAKKIYGKEFAFSQSAKKKDFVTINENGNVCYLHENAYLARTTNMLRTLLAAADVEMRNKKLGRTFQLKGLGLGAFSFAGKKNTQLLEVLYIQALKTVLRDPTFKLTYIDTINLINLPSDWPRQVKPLKMSSIKGIKLLRSSIDPTIKSKNKLIGKIGGTIFCGDSGSQVGNEGNVGLQRDSSDDPAAQYSLFNPLILDADENPVLKNKNCINLIKKNKFQLLPKIKEKIVSSKSLVKPKKNYFFPILFGAGSLFFFIATLYTKSMLPIVSGAICMLLGALHLVFGKSYGVELYTQKSSLSTKLDDKAHSPILRFSNHKKPIQHPEVEQQVKKRLGRKR